ncbi:hypothetical protein F5887DRAFT_1073458 [Amanita rubescens]|nr:hypothetical protein F5887DRAFT_1073458 [Amanita rubescens]
MPFFQGATDFKLENSELNDVAGNMTRNVTTTTTNNTDSNNVAHGSNISKGNTVTQNTTAGPASGN